MLNDIRAARFPNARLSGASLAALLAMLAANPAQAVTTTWTGATSSVWGQALNWTNGAPASAVDVVFNTATAGNVTGATVSHSILFTGAANQNFSGFALIGTGNIENQSNYVASFTGTNMAVAAGSVIRASNADGGGLLFNAAVKSTITATVTFDTVNAANTITLVKGMGSIHTLVKTGAGTLYVQGPVTTGSEFDLDGGNYNIIADSGINAVGSTVIFNGGTLQFGADFAVAASHTLTLAGSGGFDTNGHDDTITGPIGGAGGLIKTGAGTLTLDSANTYMGGTTFMGGELSVDQDAKLGDTSGALTFNGGILQVTGTAFSSTARTITWGDNGGGFDIVEAANNFAVAQALTGNGALTKLGAGTLTLTGTNSYAAGTTISGGTLIGAAGNLGTGAILDNAALVIDQPADAALPGAINGNGILLKQGAGRLNLIGGGNFSGPVTVAAGTLSVNGALANAAVTVNSGATLGGSGTVGATTIQTGAAVAPGNSIGTLHVNGAFVQGTGSTYQAELDPTSNASDLILVNGAASVAPGATLHAVRNPAGDYHADARYTVLTASGGVAGSYALTGDSAISQYLALEESLDANNIYLSVIQTGDPASAAQTSNQIAVASGLDSAASGNGAETAVLNSQSAATVPAAFNALSGEAQASARGALVSGSLLVRDTAFDRLRDLFCAASGPGHRPGCVTSQDHPAIWVRGFGNWGHLSGNANAAGLTQTTGGFLVGVDVPVDEAARVGVFGGYSRTDFDVSGRASSGNSNNYHLGAYGGTQWGDLGLKLGASYSWNAVATDRALAIGNFVNNLQAQYNAGTTQVFGELGQVLAGDRVSVEPFVNLAYVNLHTRGFSETGGDAALTSRANTMEDTFTTFGLRPSTSVAWGGIDATLRGMLGWRHTFGDVTPVADVSFAGGNVFTVAGAPIARNAGVVEAGMDFDIAHNVGFGFSYGGQFSGRETDHGIRGTLAVAF